MSLADVRHQNTAQGLLARAMKRERIPHAYIFHGPEGVGKEMFALGLAETLLCHAPRTAEPTDVGSSDACLDSIQIGCGECEDCRAMAASTHPDLHLIYRQLNRQHRDSAVRARKALDMGIDVVRQFVIEKVGLTPARGRAKVFILRDADRITPSAQNALLKTLEEPPDRTFLILLVETLDRLMPTTLSRCQLVSFNALPTDFVRERLTVILDNKPTATPATKRGVPKSDAKSTEPAQPKTSSDAELDWCAKASGGSIGSAVALAGDGMFEISDRVVDGLCDLDHALVDEIVAVWLGTSKDLGGVYRKRDPEITDTEANRRGLKSILRVAAMWYDDLLRVGADHDAVVNYAHRREQALQMAASLSSDGAASAIGRIASAERHLDLNANTQLCVDSLLIDLTRLATG